MSDDDLKNYKSIVIATDAHKKHYDANEPIRKDQGSYKFKHYIAKMIEHTGDVMSRYMIVKEDHQPDYVYWDDPTELVDRLRLLYASQEAGNASHTNEIISIIEELRDANILY